MVAGLAPFWVPSGRGRPFPRGQSLHRQTTGFIRANARFYQCFPQFQEQ